MDRHRAERRERERRPADGVPGNSGPPPFSDREAREAPAARIHQQRREGGEHSDAKCRSGDAERGAKCPRRGKGHQDDDAAAGHIGEPLVECGDGQRFGADSIRHAKGDEPRAFAGHTAVQRDVVGADANEVDEHQTQHAQAPAHHAQKPLPAHGANPHAERIERYRERGERQLRLGQLLRRL